MRNPNVTTPSRETRTHSRKKQFTLNIDISNTFEEKLNKFYEFLYIINLSNRIYRGLEIEIEKPLKFFIDKGNNANLIRNIMARRFWWEQSDKNPSFVWSQIKSPKYLSKQKPQQKGYVNSVFPSRQTPQGEGNPFKNLLQSQIHIINKMVSKIISKQDWTFISNELDGGNGKFHAKTKKIQKFIRMCQDPYNDCIMTNHLPFNGLLGNKKAMFMSLKIFYELTNQNVWQCLPETYHIEDLQDQEFKKFKSSFQKNKNKIWIVKPGQFTNRGNGIIVSDSFNEISRIINKQIGPGANSKDRTFIVQKYIEQPLLYFKRKFDIRAYMLITCSNGILKGYWYEEGYIRTSGHTFSLDDLSNTYKHLTNDAIQKFSENYGKFEKGNKLSYSDFQRYLQTYGHKLNFSRDIYPVMKKIATDAIKSTFLFLDRERLNNNFQIFGLDFMIDNQYKTYLIEINTNPCLETGCPTLDRVIPNMVENAFRIGLDPVFPPPINFPNSKKHYVSENAIQYNCFQLIFDELLQRPELEKKYMEDPKSHSKLEEISRWEHNQQVYPCENAPITNNFTPDPMQTI